ncbi:hypothetical protein GGI07_001746 [Coemansia sp. Benny D115]|nr:hypothetical protein GGI07_001746 [Coemansia sp. Benny D115]
MYNSVYSAQYSGNTAAAAAAAVPSKQPTATVLNGQLIESPKTAAATCDFDLSAFMTSSGVFPQTTNTNTHYQQPPTAHTANAAASALMSPLQYSRRRSSSSSRTAVGGMMDAMAGHRATAIAARSTVPAAPTTANVLHPLDSAATLHSAHDYDAALDFDMELARPLELWDIPLDPSLFWPPPPSNSINNAANGQANWQAHLAPQTTDSSHILPDALGLSFGLGQHAPGSATTTGFRLDFPPISNTLPTSIAADQRNAPPPTSSSSSLSSAQVVFDTKFIDARSSAKKTVEETSQISEKQQQQQHQSSEDHRGLLRSPASLLPHWPEQEKPRMPSLDLGSSAAAPAENRDSSKAVTIP